MYIYKIIIKNFRGIKELNWKPNKKRNVLIGENGCGKSTIAMALDYLLNPYMQWYKRKLNISDYYNRDVNNQIEIEVWFKEVLDFIADDNDLLLQHITGDEIDEQGDEVAVILKFVGDTNCEPSHIILSGGNEHPLYQKQKGFVGYKYVDVERNPEKELTFVTNTLVNKRFQDETLGESVQKIISDFDTYATTELKENVHFSQTLCELASSFNEFGILESHEESVSIEPTELTEYKTLQAFSLMFKNEEANAYVPMKYQSRGNKNAMLLLLLREAVQQSGIVFIEEPEQNLEPKLQRRIISKFNNTTNGQLFISTHSVDVVNAFNYDEIFLMNRNSIFIVPNPIDINASFGKRLEKYDKKEVIDGLFSSNVLIVEGDSEYGAYPIYVAQSDMSFDGLGTKLIRADGKGNIKYYAEFFAKCGKKVLCVYDNDADISSSINDITDLNLGVMTIIQKKDYEDTLFELDVFNDNWEDIMEKQYPFSDYKDVYFSPIENKKSKSAILKAMKEGIGSKTAYDSIEDILNYIGEENKREYINEFMHLNLAGIIQAKKVAVEICDMAEEQEKPFLSCSLKQLLNSNAKVLGKNRSCTNIDKCIIGYNEDDACSNCFSNVDFAKQVFYLAGKI